MKLGIRSKLVIVVAFIFLVGSVVSTVVPVVLYNRALHRQLESQADELANLVRGAHTSGTHATGVAEQMLEEQLLSSAQVIAMLVAEEGFDQSTVQQIIKSTKIEEIYITDEDGVVLFSNNTGSVGWRFPDDPTAQAYPFRALLNTRSGQVTQAVAIRDIDGQAFKFVGVSRPDRGGIIQVGVSAESLNAIMAQIGLQATIEQIVSNEGIVYAFVTDPEGVYRYHSEPGKIGEKHAELSSSRLSGQIYEYTVAVNDQGDLLRIGLSLVQFQESQRTAQKATILAIALLVVGAIGAIWLWSGTFIRSIQFLIERIYALAEGDFTIEIDTSGQDEVGNAFRALERLRVDVGQMLGNAIATAQSLAGASEELAASTQETSASIEEVASTSNQFASTVQVMGANATVISESMQAIAERASHGGRAVEDSVAKTIELKETLSELADSVSGLGERSREVGSIVELISSIADQTNLLALNAAIEAARAGEHGRGFAVVADEVRKLAEQSAQATSNITRLIVAIQDEAEQAVEGISDSAAQAEVNAEVVSESGGALQEILQAMASITQDVEGVARGTLDLRSGSEQLAAATEEQSATIEEVAVLANTLSGMSEELQELVSRFKI